MDSIIGHVLENILSWKRPISEDWINDTYEHVCPIVRGMWEMVSKFGKKDIALPTTQHFISEQPEPEIEENGYLVYQGFVILKNEYRHFIHEGMDVFYENEEILDSDSPLDKVVKVRAQVAHNIIIRKKVKMRAIHCEGVSLSRLAEHIAWYRIFQDLSTVGKV